VNIFWQREPNPGCQHAKGDPEDSIETKLVVDSFRNVQWFQQRILAEGNGISFFQCHRQIDVG